MEPVSAGGPAPTPGVPTAATPAATATPSTPLLVAGTTIDVTVLRALAAGRFLVALGNTEFVATSEAELKPGAQVRLNVAQASPDGVVLRLAEPVRAQVSAAPQRQAALNLPPGPAAAAVLAAFEEAGAPLDPLRLQAAVRAAALPAAPTRTAQAHALLARVGLPTTPALLGVALRASENRLPDVAAEMGGMRPAAAGVEVEAEAEAARTGNPVQATRSQPRAIVPIVLPDASEGAPAIRRIFALAGVHPRPEAPDEIAAPVAKTLTSATPVVVSGASTRAEARGPGAAPAPAPGPVSSATTIAEPPSGPGASTRAEARGPGPAHGPLPSATIIAEPPSGPRASARVEPPPTATRTVPTTIPGNEPDPVSPKAAADSVPLRAPLSRAAGVVAKPSTFEPHRSAALPGLATGTPVVKLPAAERAAPTQVNQQPATSGQQIAASNQQPATSSQRPADSRQQPATNDQRPAPSAQLPATSSQQAATTAQQPANSNQRTAPSAQQPAPASTPAPTSPPRSDPLAPTIPVRLSLIREIARLASEPARSAAVPTPAPETMREAPRPDQPHVAQAPAQTAARPAPAFVLQAPPANEPAAPAPPPPPTAMDETVTRTVREHLADQVFKPKDLADYDRVVPLPLSAAQVTTPARLAVASRSTGGGAQATFVRVDAELTRLGPVSIRLSGADSGGPLAITLITSRPSGAALADELPALVADLRALGLDAAVRVVADD